MYFLTEKGYDGMWTWQPCLLFTAIRLTPPIFSKVRDLQTLRSLKDIEIGATGLVLVWS